MRQSFCILALTFLMFTCVLSTMASEPDEVYYAIEQNGTVCGYAHTLITDTVIDGQPAIELVDSMWLQISAMGKTITGKYRFSFLIDPETSMYFHHSSDIEQATLKLSADMTVSNDSVRIVSLPDHDTSVVAIPRGTLLQNTRLHPYLVRWFVEDTLQSRLCTVFSEIDAKTNEVQYTKLGVEEIELAGKTYDALKVKLLNRTTGIALTMWLDAATGLGLKAEHPVRSWYLTDSTVKDRLEIAEFDRNIYAPVGTFIANPWALSYMKIHAKLQPVGMWLTPASLNANGQIFEGTVEDNRVDGIFEVRYDRYDGTDAPSFPCDFSGIDSLRPYLEPSEFIESDHPSLIEKAERITTGAEDAWEAATRLSKWVNEEISYDLPGGGTALRTYELRLGECGSHSNLLAAFCRAVGIPARGVFGCTYVPSNGGAFGQHAWSEIYMGDAGWIPVDCTADEVTYADCGHIRLGEWVSAAAMLNADTIEILDYSVGEGTFADLVKATQVGFDGLLGEYQGPDKIITVLTQDDRLALDIPGKMVFQLKDPDEDGEWFFVVTNSASVSFETDADGKAASLTLNSRQRLPRAEDTTVVDLNDVPEVYQPLVGEYALPMQNAGVTVAFSEGQLFLSFSPEHSMPLEKDPEKSRFLAKSPRSTLAVSFDVDDANKVTAMRLSELVRCPRIVSTENP
jgi:transglutaminase-like putative cysteine protease